MNNQQINNVLHKWENEIAPFLATGNAIYIATFTIDGQLTYSNATMDFLKDGHPEQYFINPKFDTIISSTEFGEIFSGMLTLGSITSMYNNSIIAKIYRSEDEILIIGEHDINQIVEQNKAIHELNSLNSNLNRQLQKEKKMLEITKNELIKSEAKLQQSNAAKDKFFSIIAHDLRGPLSSFIGLSELLATEYETLTIKDLRDISETMHRTANSVFNLLNELLMWSRSQMGVIPFNPEDIDVYELLYNNVYMLKEVAKMKGINISIKSSGEFVAFCDRNMMMTVIRNLLGNAIKFSHKNSEIALYCEFYGEVIDSQNIDYIKVSVIDNGIGISEKTLQGLFKVGANVSSRGTNDEQGTGLGLLLCKDFIDKHNGRIWAESELGVGSTFSFILPIIKKNNNMNNN